MATRTTPSAGAAPSPRPPLLTCPHCGALNEPSFFSCVRCAQPLGNAAAARPHAAPSTAAPAAAPPWGAAPPRPRRPSALAALAPGSGLIGTQVLFGLTSLAFAAHLLVSLGREPSLSALLLGGSVVDAVRFGALAPGSAQLLFREPWRLWSAMFVHFGILHFVLNMLGLLYLGRIAEPAIGAARFILVYLATGLLGFGTTAIYFLVTGQGGLTAGASGALFGLMGLILGLLVRRGDPRWKIWATQAVLFSVLLGFAIQVANNSAHLGGLGGGVLLGLWLAPAVTRPAPRWLRVAAAVGIAGSVASLAAAQLSPLWRLLAEVAPG